MIVFKKRHFKCVRPLEHAAGVLCSSEKKQTRDFLTLYVRSLYENCTKFVRALYEVYTTTTCTKCTNIERSVRTLYDVSETCTKIV